MKCSICDSDEHLRAVCPRRNTAQPHTSGYSLGHGPLAPYTDPTTSTVQPVDTLFANASSTGGQMQAAEPQGSVSISSSPGLSGLVSTQQ